MNITCLAAGGESGLLPCGLTGVLYHRQVNMIEKQLNYVIIGTQARSFSPYFSKFEKPSIILLPFPRVILV